MKKDDPIHSGPNIGESLETYFGKPEFLRSFKKLTVSKPEEQEAANRIFSASLTPSQRLEYMYYLQKIFFAEQIAKAPTRYTGKVHFD